MCFKWALLSALHPADKNAQRVSKYVEYKDELNFDDLTFPFDITLDNVNKVENLNNFNINIWTVYDEDSKNAKPMYKTHETFEKTINLFYMNIFHG